MYHVLTLHHELATGTYQHGSYHHFKISDPKPRDIHKASVRDRLVHHAIYRVFYPHFDKHFIADSYSCREEKGTHKAMSRFRAFAYKVSHNNTRTCWVLKCDIRKFFASIDHPVLLAILARHLRDERTLALVTGIIQSFSSGTLGKGLPLGNLTSQLLVNIYMNEFDQFIKHTFKVKHYIRYADDFVLLSPDKNYLIHTVPYMELFLREELKLELHPKKLFLKTLASGIDFLGWVNFTDHRVLRTATKKRMFRALRGELKPEALTSYRGLLGHGNAFHLQKLVMWIAGGLREGG